jgi:lipid-A-disaccharide synthase-like uncharacterized protein
VKPGPILAMISLLFVGLWLAAGPSVITGQRTTPGAARFAVVLGARKIQVERLSPAVPRPAGDARAGTLYRFVSDLPEKGWLEPAQYELVIARELDRASRRPWLLRVANASQWGSLVWVGLGLLGQTLFMGRMLLQWVVSEKERRSHITPAFWWFSFVGGTMLFAYFVWRQDPIGVLGQSTGVVIYARNLRLIYKQRRREARVLAGPAGPDADRDSPAARGAAAELQT